jgi:hypothetical protein
VPSPTEAAKGGFAQFVYFARGRLALATPGWSPALQMARNEAARKRGSAESEGGPNGDRESGSEPRRQQDSGETDPDGRQDPGASEPEPGAATHEVAGDESVASDEPDEAAEPDEVAEAETDTGAHEAASQEPDLTAEAEFRDWLVTQDPSGWLEWTALAHPDFPDAEAQAGGYAPLARINPPIAVVDSIAPAHVALVERLLRQLPRVQIREARLEALGNNLHELRFTVQNTGRLPDRLSHGIYSAEVRPSRFELRLPQGGAVLGGAPRGPIETLEGSGGSREVRRVVQIPSGGKVTIEVISELGGRDARAIGPGEHWRASSGGSR